MYEENIAALKEIVDLAYADPAALHSAPHNTPVGRPDEAGAARNPVVKG